MEGSKEIKWKQLKEKLAGPLLILLIAYFVFRLSKEYIRYKAFENCSVETKAIVIDKDIVRRSSKHSRRRSYDLKLQYRVEGQLIKRKKSTASGDYRNVSIGDSIIIQYACKYPKWYQYTEFKNRDLIISIPKSWL